MSITVRDTVIGFIARSVDFEEMKENPMITKTTLSTVMMEIRTVLLFDGLKPASLAILLKFE
jgi:uncharacterized protein YneF (UPF0154 family)